MYSIGVQIARGLWALRTADIFFSMSRRTSSSSDGSSSFMRSRIACIRWSCRGSLSAPLTAEEGFRWWPSALICEDEWMLYFRRSSPLLLPMPWFCRPLSGRRMGDLDW